MSQPHQPATSGQGSRVSKKAAKKPAGNTPKELCCDICDEVHDGAIHATYKSQTELDKHKLLSSSQELLEQAILAANKVTEQGPRQRGGVHMCQHMQHDHTKGKCLAPFMDVCYVRLSATETLESFPTDCHALAG